MTSCGQEVGLFGRKCESKKGISVDTHEVESAETQELLGVSKKLKRHRSRKSRAKARNRAKARAEARKGRIAGLARSARAAKPKLRKEIERKIAALVRAR